MASDFILNLLKALDSEMLEELVLAHVNSEHQPTPAAQRIGVSGQSQDGVDVYAYAGSLGHIGYQCKAYVKSKLTKTSFERELSLCSAFTPPLDYYFVVTLNSRDAKLQKLARESLLHGRANRISIIALEDLASLVGASQGLTRQLFDNALRPSDVRQFAEYLAPVSGTTSYLPPQEEPSSIPDDLRTAEDWIENGMPLRAIAVLDARAHQGHQQAVARIRCRALYSLERYSEILAIAETEGTSQTPNASTLMLGALAAGELGNHATSERLAAASLEAATDSTRADAVGGLIRLRALRGKETILDLERLAQDHLGSCDRVAVALADAAASMGESRRAAHWFELARKRRPSLGLGVQINELASALAIATDESDNPALSRIVVRLEQLLLSFDSAESGAFRRVVLTNLGAAYRACNRIREAATAWDEALELGGKQRDIWIHRCLLGEQDRGVLPPSERLAAMYAIDPTERLAYASALTSASRSDEAALIVKEILATSDTTPLELSVAHVERLRIRLRNGDERQDVIVDGLAHVSTKVDSMPMLGWISAQHRHASRENKQLIDELLRTADPGEFGPEAILGISTPLAMGSSGIALGHWVPRLKEISFSDSGDLINEHAAMVLAEVQADCLDLMGCNQTLEAIRNSGRSSSALLLRLAQAYYQSGNRALALDTLQETIVSTDVSAQVVRDWAQMSASQGRRREAKKLFEGMNTPKPKNVNDYIWLMQARVILGIREDDSDATALLRSGLVTPDSASQVFALGINQKSRRPAEVVERNTIVAVHVDGEVDDTFFIGDPGATPLPGIRSLDPVSHPWLDQLIGLRVGAHITLAGDPFAGKVAEIRSITRVSEFMYSEALRQINLSSRDQTGFTKISGNVEHQLDEAKKLLADRHKEMDDHLDRATRARFSASLMAKQFRASPREFLFKSRSWTPVSHSGNAADIAADQATLDRSNGWIFDATTVLLLAMIGAEEFPNRLHTLPRITKLAVGQLCDWRSDERERRRAAGHMNLDDSGALQLTTTSAADRVDLLLFWKKVQRIVGQCVVIDVPTVKLSEEAALLLEVVGPETLATYQAAKFHKLTLISEELNVRDFATASTGVSSVALHSLLVEAFHRKCILPEQTMLWISRLIEFGWTWVQFPSDWLVHCMYLPEKTCWRVLDSLCSRLKTADPLIALKSVLTSLSVIDAGKMKVTDPDRYRRTLIAALPTFDEAFRRKAARAYSLSIIGRRVPESTARILGEWVSSK
jgi:tetratricopeptide (TPR) repeat protein